jgi:hypothetical protein
VHAVRELAAASSPARPRRPLDLLDHADPQAAGPPDGTGSYTTHSPLYQPFQEARRFPPDRSAGKVHQSGGRHRAKKHPGENGNAGQG